MRQLRFVRVLSPIAAALALFYVALAILASVCLFDHPDHPTSHERGHHHSNKVAHSALCAWACQANPGTALLSAAPLTQPFELLCYSVLASITLLFSSLIARLRSRGPPRSF